MKRIYIPLFAALMASSPSLAQTKPLVLTGQAEYYLKGISPNGEWAYGVYMTYTNQAYGFRWNLKSNKIEMLSNGNVQCEPNSVSNNGILTGYFTDNSVVPNGATVHNEGVWNNGKWSAVETPEGVPVMGTDRSGEIFSVANNINGVSVNGEFVTGEVNYGQVAVWKDGKIAWSTKHNGNSICRSYCVSNDGTIMGGWGYATANDQERLPVIWKKDGKVINLPVGRYSPLLHPFQGVFNITSNQRYALYWGNYLEEDPTTANPSGVSTYAAYDLENDQVIAIPMYTPTPGSGHWSAINASGTMLGYETGSFKKMNEDGTIKGDSTYLFMWKDNQRTDLYKYLESKGVDFESLPGFLSIDTQGLGISDDEKTFSLRYYDAQGGTHPLIIKLDENTTSRPPVQLTATRLTAVNGVMVEWLQPLAGADGVKGYKLFRDGQLLASTDASTLRYTDSSVKEGETHTYTVKAVYADTESEACDEASITLTPVQPKAPNSLFARQTRQAQALFDWNTPKSNLTTKNYYDDVDSEVTGFGGGSNSFEVAINIPADEMALYKTQKLTAVQFYPMSEQNGWTINIYAHDPATGALTTLTSQPVTQTLNYGKPNKVVLAQPLSVPDGKDLYVAIAVTAGANNEGFNVIGEVNGITNPGYTDLLRQAGDGNAFESTYAMAQEDGYSSANTWAIDAILTPEGASADIDNVTSYEVSVDGTKVGTTNGLTFTTGNLSDGVHTLGVKAVYADGRISPAAEKTITIASNENYFQAIENLNITQKGGQEGVNIAWNAPLDNDAKIITYSYAGYYMGISTNEEAYWNLTARNEYLPEMFKSYEGYNITAGRFYPGADAIYTLTLYADGVKVAEKEVENYTLNQWNEVRFDTPVKVKEGVTYTYDVDCYDVTTEGKPLAVDAGAENSGYSNLFSQDGGESWETLMYNNDIHGNWMIGLKLETDDNKVVPELQGYKVVIDTRNSYTLGKDATSYDYKPATIDSKNHRVRVDAIYDVKGTVKGNTVYFTFDTNTGISDASVQQIEVNRSGSAIEVTGTDVKSLTLFAADGKQVAKAQGNSVSVTTLPAGSYVLSVLTANGETKSIKVAVK